MYYKHVSPIWATFFAGGTSVVALFSAIIAIVILTDVFSLIPIAAPILFFTTSALLIVAIIVLVASSTKQLVVSMYSSSDDATFDIDNWKLWALPMPAFVIFVLLVLASIGTAIAAIVIVFESIYSSLVFFLATAFIAVDVFVMFVVFLPLILAAPFEDRYILLNYPTSEEDVKMQKKTEDYRQEVRRLVPGLSSYVLKI